MEKSQLQEITTFLSQISFFSEVSKASLSHLCENLETEIYRKNQIIFEKDSIGEEMYVILDGTVKVQRCPAGRLAQ